MKSRGAKIAIVLLCVGMLVLGGVFFADHQNSSKQIEALTTEAAEKSARIEDLSADAADKAARIETLTAENADKAAQIETLTADSVEKAAQIESLTADNAEKAAQGADIGTEPGQTDQAAPEGAENAGPDQTGADKDPGQVPEAADKGTEPVEEVKDEKDAMIETMSAELSEKTAQIESLTVAAAEKDSRIESLVADAAEQASKIESLNADVADKASQIENLNADVADKASQIENLTTDNTRLTEENAACVAHVDVMDDFMMEVFAGMPGNSMSMMKDNGNVMMITRIRTTAETRPNLRAKPGLTEAIIGFAEPDTIYQVLEISDNGWYKIRLVSGQIGWVHSNLCTLEEVEFQLMDTASADGE